MPPDSERLLIPQWAPELVVLSYAISWLGAYTSTQIVIHAKYTRNPWAKWLWTLLASLAFGFCAIWSMHFVGMLACRFDVQVVFDCSLTLLSTSVAVSYTFAAFAMGSPHISRSIQQSRFAQVIIKFLQTLQRCLFSCCPEWDVEAGYEQPSGGDHEGPSPAARDAELRKEDEENEHWQDMDFYTDEPPGFPARQRANYAAFYDAEMAPPPDLVSVESPSIANAVVPDSQRALLPSPARLKGSATMGRSSTHPEARSTTVKPVPFIHRRSLPRPTPVLMPPESPERETLSSSSSLTSLCSSSLSRPRANSKAGSSLSGATATGSLRSSQCSGCLSDVRMGLSQEARMRIRACAQARPVPVFGGYWMLAQWRTVTALVVIRAAVWGLALIMMHHCGMWAMIIPRGRITWNLGIVALSYIVAFMVAFSTFAALGVCCMHYMGMAAATFHTYSPPAPPGQSGYPTYLPVMIVGIALSVCIMSNMALSHSAIIARNKMAEMILTKRRLWRIMAEKEAAEQANERKQQFISVASHEIRTPLHTMNGYCELMAKTSLTEEQAFFVSSIQQAYHAINVIAGNVLDFSQLDSNKAEPSAKPALMKLRKVIEDAVRIQPNQHGVELVVSVTDDVPHTVLQDETYIFRVLMNLLSNAQKFCEKGYISVVVRLGKPGQIVFQVRDTGVGIPASFRGALFKPFWQADQSLTRPKQGTGLGLSIVKNLVSRMNGTVDVESVEGEGSTFNIRLPIAITDHAPSAIQDPLLDLSSKQPPPRATGKRIRIIHSNPLVESLLVQLFSDHGYAPAAGLSWTAVHEIVQNTDAVWADVESVASSLLLRVLICAQTSRSFPVYVVHTDSRDLGKLESELGSARNAVFLKRPMVLHTLRDALENPEPRMGAHIMQLKVQLAPPVSPVVDEVGSLQKQEAATPKRKEIVLLVEDNLVNQRLGKRQLEKLGYEVVAVNDGQQAIEAVKQQTFHGCLMDCQMPVLDGFAAARRIRIMERDGVLQGHLPIVALTANVTMDSEGRCLEAGMDHFLPKPLDMADLEAALKAHSRTAPHR